MGNNQNRYSEEEKKLKKSYYKILSKTTKKRYDDNRTDLFNQNFSLFQKDFEKSYINQRIPQEPLAGQFISWKTYLLRYLFLLEDNEGYIWSHNLCEIIKPENFPEQIKFQNLFFYQEQRILSNIKLSSDEEFDLEDFGYNNILKGNDLINNINEPLLEVPKDPFNMVKNRISNVLMTSFMSGGSESVDSSVKKDPNKEYHYNKVKIKEYMEIFKQHLSIKEHPINFVISQFIIQFVPLVREVNEYYKKNSYDKKDSCDEKAKDIIKQLQDFISLIQTIIKLFYSRSISYYFFKDEKDEFLNLSSLIIFNNDKIYKSFSELFKTMNKEKIQKLEEKYTLLGDLSPEDFGIKDVFCLNQRTQDLMEKLKQEKNKSNKDSDSEDDNNDNKEKNDKLTFNMNGEEKIINEEEDINTSQNKQKEDSIINNTKHSINNNTNFNESQLTAEDFKITSETGKLNIFTKEIFDSAIKLDSNEPYYEAILYIKKVLEFKVPLEKLLLVASLSGVITGCVNKFWKNNESIIKPEMLSIDSDELMTIFLYIIYKCKISSLFIHADFINYFVTQTTKAGMIGYYNITFQGCLEFLLNVKDKSDFKK